jgi:nucleoside-diphosphate-sugar epimerase
VSKRRVLVTGAGGFIGHHLVRRLKQHGDWVRGVDIKPPEFADSAADEFWLMDLRVPESALAAMEGVEEAYALAADMGGMGFISKDEATILHNNTMIDLNSVAAAVRQGVKRYFYASSACIYPTHLQTSARVKPLAEADGHPAAPEGGYGWEKIYAEVALAHFAEQHGIEPRIARLHNVYGPQGTFEGGREKVPAALCRKVASAPDGGRVEIWGDGEQTRSLCYIEDCLTGMQKLMRSDFSGALNIGSDRLVSVNELAALVARAAGRDDLTFVHVAGPQGVRGRNSDNELIARVLGWQPGIPLEEGLEVTYAWIEEELGRRAGAGAGEPVAPSTARQ